MGGHDVIDIAREFVRELRGRRPRAVGITPQGRLDRDLGIDSLRRTELILRIERAAGARRSEPSPEMRDRRCFLINYSLMGLESKIALRCRSKNSFTPARFRWSVSK